MFDFKQDLIDEMLVAAKTMGFRISQKNSFDNILLDYLTVRFKFITPKVRRTIMSPPLLNDFFTHPKRATIERLFHLSDSGQDINLFQSKRVLQSKFHDHMLNSWKIHHFHLSTKRNVKSNFVKQGDDLLFAYIDDENALFLGLDKHKDGVFGDQKWLELLHDYFPEIMEPLKVKDVLDLSHNLNALERQTLWNKGFNTGMTKIRGVIYFGPGFGGMTSGHGYDVVSTANKIRKWLNTIEKQLKENHSLICDYAKLDEQLAVFRIKFNDKQISLYDETSNTVVLNFPTYFNFKI